MRKKSHISLARYIVRNIQVQELWKHRKGFYVGSILPDCKFSFLTTKHEFDGTFSMLKEKIEKATEYVNEVDFFGKSYAIELGEIIHYMADYFTFPHNLHYAGDLKDHCIYENDLKKRLRVYLKEEMLKKQRFENNWFENKEELFAYIEKMHKEYMSKERSIEEDCEYIVRVCSQVVNTILRLVEIESEYRLCIIS